MTMIILVSSFLSVFSLFFGFASVFAANSRTRFKCAVGYVIFVTLGAISALFEKSEFLRLLESAIVALAMAPVLTLWLLTLRTRGRQNAAQRELRGLHKPHSPIQPSVATAHGKLGSKEADRSLQVK